MKNLMRFLSNPDRTGLRPAPQHDLSGARPRGAQEVSMSFRSMIHRACLTLGLVALAATSAVAAGPKLDKRVIPVGAEQGLTVSGETLRLTSSAVVNFSELARMEKLGFGVKVPDRQRHMMEEDERELNEFGLEPGAGMVGAPAPILERPFAPIQPNVPSPTPVQGFQGLDDIAMVDSLYIIIPPDLGGAVGPSKVMSSHNNNYRIFDKATGTVLSTVGTATFWAPVVAVAERASLTDPRTMYDPYNNRWIAVMQTVTTGAGKLLIGVSQTSDPSGAWYLYNFNTAFTVDFPNVGFNKNWIAININRYSNAGAFQRGLMFVVSSPAAMAGTLTAGTTFTATAGTGFCAAPVLTYSATQESLFVVTHLSSTAATYQVGAITGTPTAPVYTASVSGTLTRPGGAWVQPTGNQQPQAAPLAGVSACGATPCAIESQDSQIRTYPVYRPSATEGGNIYYAQTINLPSTGFTHTAIQWTKLRTGVTFGSFSDGGRIEDATATSTNGGKFYDNGSIAVNSIGDILVGFTQFSSAAYPSAAYAYHDHNDAAGTMRDPIVTKAGEDYYHKTFSTATGRNRWGDYGTVQVDPSDDLSIWSLQEYAKARTATADDGNTGANSSRWSSWWAKMSPGSYFTITASAGTGGSITPSGGVSVAAGGSQSFTISTNSCYTLNNVLVDGVAQGPITSYTFTNVQANHTIAAQFTLNTFAIVASSGANGTVTPAGSTDVNCGQNLQFAITPASCYHVANVLVDGASVGAVTSYTFSNVQAAHTISATFAANLPSTITVSAGPNGSATPLGANAVNCGDSLVVSIAPASCYRIAGVLVDGVSQGAISSYTFRNVQANHTLVASFAINTYTVTASAGANGAIAPSGTATLNCGTSATYTITPNVGFYTSSLLVDGAPVTPAPSYTFTSLAANHTIAAAFSPDTSTVSAGSTAVILSPAHPNVTIPVNIHRLSNAPLLGFSVTLQLSPELSLNYGQSGLFLGNVGAMLFNSINHGNGLYTFDGALTENCGATALDGDLFSLNLSSAAASGTGTVSIVSALLRNCDNVPQNVAAGAAGSIAIDNQGPSITINAPVGGEVFPVGSSQAFNWSVSDDHDVSSVQVLLSRNGAAGTFASLATLNKGVNPLTGYNWTVTGPNTSDAFLKVTATDSLGNSASALTAASFTIGATSGVDAGPVTEFALSPVVPNPSKGRAQLTFALPREAHVHVGIVDLQGREVLTLADGVYGAGRHTAQMATQNTLSPGLYFVRMSVPGKTLTTRFMQMK